MENMMFSDEFNVGYWEWTVKGNSGTLTAPDLKKWLGYRDDDFPNTPIAWKQIVPPGDSKLIMSRYYRHIRGTRNTPFAFVVRCRHRDGHWLDIQVIGRVVAWDKNRRPRVMTGSHTDMSPVRESQRYLQSQKTQLMSFILDSPAALAILDKDMNYIAVSHVWCRIYNLVAADLIGKNHYQLFPHLPERWKEHNRRCLAGEVLRGAEDSFIRLDGTIDYIEWEMRPWHENDGAIGGLIVYTQIITEKVRAKKQLIAAKEEAEHATSEKSRFLAMMSHEIRTPMNAVIGFTNLLLTNPREDQREYLNILKFSAQNLLVLINDILDLNKIDADKVELERIEFDLPATIENIASTLRPFAAEKGLYLRVDMEESLPRSLKGDPVRLGQVITNLVNNAIKFTAVGGIVITLKAGVMADGTLPVSFSVKDTDIGIPQHKQEFIFEAFSQASTDTTRLYGGTGLGLTISKKLVELMGGDIRLKSRTGRGAEFYFDIGMGTVAGVIPVGKPATIALPPLKAGSILVVDDNKINCTLMTRFMESWNLHCDVALRGREALEMIRRKRYDLVFMDIQMPGMDGYQVTSAIRRMRGSYYKKVPIIALTASLLGNDHEKLLVRGLSDYVPKPFDPNVLHAKIMNYLHPSEDSATAFA